LWYGAPRPQRNKKKKHGEKTRKNAFDG